MAVAEPPRPAQAAGPTSGGLQSLICPTCKGFVRARQLEPGRELRCSLCRSLIGGVSGGLVQWLYPERSREPTSPTSGEPGGHLTFRTEATLDTDPAHPDPGPRRIGRYELRGELGCGGMGVVYDAWDTELRRDAAVKVLLAGAFASNQARQRFVAEARAAAGLHHVHIVSVFEMGEVDNQPWFAMERVFGPSLEDVLSVGGPLSIDEAVRVVTAVALAVAHAHAHSVAHRDLKPGNVLIDGDGHPRITDFGLARPLDVARHLTATHQVLGTPAYMAPEVARAETNIDWARVDVYGVGAVLYAALTARPPANGSTIAERLAAASRGDRAPLRRLRPEVSPSLDAIVSKALHPEVAHRYASASALAEDLRHLQAGEPTSARPETLPERAARWSRRHARALTLGGLVTLAITVAAAWAPVRAVLEEQRREAQAAQVWSSILPTLGTPAGEQQLLTFAEAPEYHGTQAVAEAWLRRGDDLAARPHPHGEWGRPSKDYVDAWARALTEAPDSPTRAAALLRLARASKEHGHLTDLDALVGALEAMPAGTVAESDLVPLQIWAALYRDDHAQAAVAWDRAVALGLPIAKEIADPRWVPPFLEQAERVPLLDGEVIPGLGDGPAGPWVLSLKPNEAIRVDLLPTPHVGATFATPTAGWYPGKVVSWGEQGLEQRFGTYSHVFGDVDGDGARESYTTKHRVLYRGTASGEHYEPIIPELRRTNAELKVDVADLNADGQDELIVAASEWTAYDLRVYDYRDGDYRLRARAARNATASLQTIDNPWDAGRLVFSVEYDHYSNVRRHGEENPDGPPSALVVRRLVGDQLEDVFTWVLPTGASVWPGGLVADIDGDGLEELIVSFLVDDRLRTAVFRPMSEPYHYALSLQRGVMLTKAMQLDADPAMELLTEVWLSARGDAPSSAAWLLGRGDAPYPADPPLPAPPLLELPEGALERSTAQAWRDAQVLHHAGIDRGAAAALLRAAQFDHDPDAAMAASRLWAAIDDLHAAAEAAERAAESADLRAASDQSGWGGAVDAWLAASDPESALRVAERWRAAGGAPDPARAATLAVWDQARAARLTLTPGAAFDDTWRIFEPLAIDLRGSRTHVHALQRNVTVLSLPVRPVGGPLAMILDFVLDPIESRSGLSFGFSREPGPAGQRWSHGLEAGMTGTGAASHFGGGCVGNGVALPPQVTRTIAPIPGRLRLTWEPADSTWRCTINFPSLHEGSSGSRQAPLLDPLSLDLYPTTELGPWMGIEIERLELWGLEPDPQPPTPIERANLALVRQDPTTALALLGPDDDAERAIALAMARRPAEAIEALRRALARDPASLTDRLPYMLRVSRDLFAPLLRAAAGPSWPRLFFSVYAAPIWMNVSLPSVDEALRVDLDGLPYPDDPEDDLWMLHAERVAALLRGPDPARGRTAAAELFSVIDARNPPRGTELWAISSRVHRELAFEAAARLDLATATREGQIAVDQSPTPVLASDRFRVSAVWQAAKLPLPVAQRLP